MITLKKHSNNFSVKIGHYFIPIEESLISYLCEEIKLEKGVTFGDFFNIILKHHKEYSDVFYSHLSGVPLSDFIPEWSQLAERTDDNMDALVITWENMYVPKESLINKDEGLEIPWLPSFLGKGTDDKNLFYAIEFTPLNELRKYPLELIKNTKVYDMETDELLLFIDRGFTVYEVLSAIFYEITFSGTPTMRNKKIKSLRNSAENFEKELDKQKKTKSLEEVLKELKIDLPKNKE